MLWPTLLQHGWLLTNFLVGFKIVGGVRPRHPHIPDKKFKSLHDKKFPAITGIKLGIDILTFEETFNIKLRHDMLYMF